MSWQFLDVFQRRETLKLKKEINVSKLPAGSPERCLIQEAGAEWDRYDSAKLSQAGMHGKEAGFLSFLIKSSQPLAIAPGVIQPVAMEADVIVVKSPVLCSISTFLLSYLYAATAETSGRKKFR